MRKLKPLTTDTLTRGMVCDHFLIDSQATQFVWSSISRNYGKHKEVITRSPVPRSHNTGHQTVWSVGTADTCVQWVVYDEQELDVDVQRWADGPVAGSLYPESEELPQIETQGSVTSEVPTCASEQPSLLQTKLGLVGVALLESPLNLKTLYD